MAGTGFQQAATAPTPSSSSAPTNLLEGPDRFEGARFSARDHGALALTAGSRWDRLRTLHDGEQYAFIQHHF
jgi:hypothetical protein